MEQDLVDFQRGFRAFDPMAYMAGSQADFPQILEQIRNEDEMMAYAGVQQLSTHLSMAQDNQLRNIPLEEVIQALIAVLKRPALTDFSTEVKFHAVLSFANLMDISPNIVGTVVNHGGVQCLCETMINAMHFIELSEACIKALEKISVENPYVVLTSQTLQISLNMIDFFDKTIQHKIIEIALHVSRHSANKQDYENYLLPVMPSLAQLLNMRGEHNKKVVENVTTVFLRIAESFLRIHNQKLEFGQISELYMTLLNCGIIDAFQQILVEASLNYQTNRQEDDSNRTFTPSTITQVLKVLTLACKYSAIISNQQLNNNALKQVEIFLPELKSSDHQVGTYLASTIVFIDSMIPEKAETLEQQDYPPERVLCESDKKERFSDSSLVASTAEKILPRLFKAYEDSISPSIRQKCLKVIDKTIALMDTQMLANFIEPYDCAKFLYGIFKAQDLSQSLVCCQIVRQLCCSQSRGENTHQFVVAFMREGIFSFVKELASGKEKIENIYGIVQKKKEDPRGLQQRLEEKLAMERKLILERSAILMERRQQEVQETGKTDQEKEERRKIEEALMQKHMDLLQMKQKQDLDLLQQKIRHAELGQRETNHEQEVESLLKLTQEICQSKVLSEEFQAEVREKHGEEVGVLAALSEVGHALAKRGGDFKQSLKRLVTLLQGRQKITLHEFEQSGVMKALSDFLTQTQSMLLKEERDTQEDCKMEDVNQEMTDAEAKEALKRLKDFAELMVKGEQAPMLELIKLCHEEIAANDTYIFKDSSLLKDDQAADLFSHAGANQFFHNTQRSLDQMRAMSSKRIKISLEYDQKRSIVLSSPTQMPELVSSKSAPFVALQGDSSKNNLSKVFTKRDYLYSEMKYVSISVDHCASLWLLEDFLRQRVKSIDDVKSLKRQVKQQNNDQQKQLIRNNEIAMEMIEAAKERLKELMENHGDNEEQIQLESQEFAISIAADIVDAIENGEITDEEWPMLVKEMEVQSLIFMEELYGENLLGAQQKDEGDIQQAKITAFHNMIAQIRTYIAEKRGGEQKQPLLKKEEVKDEEMKDTTVVKKQVDAQMVEDQSEPMAISEEEEESKGDSKAQKKQAAEEPLDLHEGEEEEEELFQEGAKKQPNPMEATAQKKEAQGLVFSQKKEAENRQELDELIKANGEDIEFEFAINGKVFQQNQTILEIVNKQRRKHPGQIDSISISFAIKDFATEQSNMRKDSLIEYTAFKDSPVKTKRSMSLAVSENESPAQQFVSDLFLNKFKVFEEEEEEEEEEEKVPNLFQSFQDLFGRNPGEELPKLPEPLSEEQQQKEKEEKELAAIKKKEIQQLKKKQRASLLHAFKLLKVCHLVVNEPLLVASNCELLVGQELDEQTEISEVEYAQKVASIGPQVFCHNKLNQFLMKNIQDPYNLMGDVISGRIKDVFANCAFLFPFSTRMLFFKLMTFMGAIDMYRSIYFLKQFLKQRGANIVDDKNIGKTQKQKAQVDRSQLLRSAIHIMKHQKKQAFLEISYKDEPGTGLGPTLEFYHLVAQEVRSQVELWKKMPDNSLFPAPIVMREMNNEQIAQVYDVWRLIGCVTAKSIVDDRIVDFPFNALFWDLVLGKKTSLFDLNKIQPEVAKNFVDFQRMANRRKQIVQKVSDPEVLERQLSNIKTSFGSPIEEIGLNFTLPGDPSIELKPEGAKIAVSLENLQEYIDLTLHYTFHDTLKLQLNAFKKGFNSIFSLESLKCFSYQEIEELICGEKQEEWNDVNKLAEIVVPAHGYHHKSQQFQDFLKYMTTLGPMEKRKFLQFVTGAPRLPLGGLAHLQPKLTVVERKTEFDCDSALPTVMTCVNYVKLPPYSGYDILKLKFDLAIQEGHNNFNLS